MLRAFEDEELLSIEQLESLGKSLRHFEAIDNLTT